MFPGVEKLELLDIVGGDIKEFSFCEEEFIPQNLHVTWTYNPAIPLLYICQRKLNTGAPTKQVLHHITCKKALCTTAKRQKPPKCPSMDESINKMLSLHRTEYNLVTSRNEALIQATTCMDLEMIRLSERSQTQKANMIWFHLYEMSRMANQYRQKVN